MAKSVLLIILKWVVVGAVFFFAIREGLALRKWIYVATVPYRFDYDINNAWTQGRSVVLRARKQDPKADRVSFGDLMRAYLARYDEALVERPNGDYQLDYPPARLLIMTIWQWHESDDGLYQNTPKFLINSLFGKSKSPAELAGPLLNVNTFFELAAMAGAFMLVRAVLRRANCKGAEYFAILPVLLVWFNPALLLDAHAWPQWEAWPLPFWLWAGYFAVTRRWLVAGMCLGIGTMFKGQIMITMGFFVLWPLFQMRWRAVLEVCVGILLGMMVMVSLWMLQTGPAYLIFGVTLVICVAMLPWMGRGWRVVALCGVVGITLLLCGLFLGGSFAWWHVGFEYGSQRWEAMSMGATPNLSAALSSFGWSFKDVVYTVNWAHPAIHAEITIQYLMYAIYVVGLVIGAVAAALQDSRADRRLLLAMATPWLVMFAFLPQMHERYLVWGAVLTGLAAAVSVGSTLLHLVVTVIAFSPIAQGMMGGAGNRDFPGWGQFFDRVTDQSAEVTMLLALIFIYLSLAGPRRKKLSKTEST